MPIPIFPFSRSSVEERGDKGSCLCCVWYVQGLQVGDELVQFGSVSAANFTSMQSIAAVVEHSKGVSQATSIHAQPVTLAHSFSSVNVKTAVGRWTFQMYIFKSVQTRFALVTTIFDKF